jgi:hypothetical protein
LAAAADDSQMRIEVTTAVIAAAASLGGAIVGGGVTYLANEGLREEQDERERAGARAVAMLEANRFRTVETAIRTMQVQDVYLERGSEVRSDFSSEDLALVVARLTGRQSALLADARVCVDRLDNLLAGDKPGERVDLFDANEMRALRECVHDGRAALAPLVNIEPVE